MEATLLTAYQLPDANAHYLPSAAGFNFMEQFGYVPEAFMVTFLCEETLAPGSLDLCIQVSGDSAWAGAYNDGWATFVDYNVAAKFSASTGKLTAALSVSEAFLSNPVPGANLMRVWVDAAATIDGANYWTIQIGIHALRMGR
jgi:hypothetical protein